MIRSEHSKKHKGKLDTSARCENPGDKLVNSINNKVAPIFKNLNYTPIGITAIGTIFMIAALYNLYHGDLSLFTIFMILAYIFNRLDSYYAEVYGFTDGSDDRYSRLRDLIMFVITIYILYVEYGLSNHTTLFVIISVFLVLSIVTIGCEKKLCTDFVKGSDTIIDKMTPSIKTCHRYMDYLKYLGPSTMTALLIFSAWYLMVKSVDDSSTTVTDSYQPLEVVDVNRPFTVYPNVINDLTYLTWNQPSSYRF